jgi:hypothetical protein
MSVLPEMLNPEFIASNVTGSGLTAATVYLIMKGKTDVLRESIKNLSMQVAQFNSQILHRIERLENIELEVKQK